MEREGNCRILRSNDAERDGICVARSQEPELQFLHAQNTLNRAKLETFRRLPTDELVSSLAPGGAGALKVRPDGTVLDGHHRLRVLLERGIDIDCLPREIIEKKKE